MQMTKVDILMYKASERKCNNCFELGNWPPVCLLNDMENIVDYSENHINYDTIVMF